MLHSRIERIQSLIQVEAAQIIDRELNNPNLPEFITIHQVKISKDLSRAVIVITFLQDQSQAVIDETVKELNKAAGFVSRLLAQRIQLRRHPQIKFVYTDSTRFALDIEKLFQQIKREDLARAENAPEENAPEENVPE